MFLFIFLLLLLRFLLFLMLLLLSFIFCCVFSPALTVLKLLCLFLLFPRFRYLTVLVVTAELTELGFVDRVRQFLTNFLVVRNDFIPRKVLDWFERIV